MASFFMSYTPHLEHYEDNMIPHTITILIASVELILRHKWHLHYPVYY